MQKLDNSDLCLLSAKLENPHGYGRIVRDGSGKLHSIVEERDASDDQRALPEVNTGILGSGGGHLARLLNRLDCDNAQNEYLLTDVIEHAREEGLRLSTVTTDDANSVNGINDRVQLAAMERSYQAMRAEELMICGVSLADPARIDIRGDLACGQDTRIDINCVFEGNNRIGERVSIGANCVIVNSVVADDVVIEPNCVIENADIGDACQLGPFARVRPGTRLDERAKLGNFVETKNSHIGPGSKVNHLAYVGDSDVDRGVNIGAGAITANYDGANKHRTVIGRDVFVGCNSVLVAPIRLGAGSTIGAGTTISRDTGDNELVVTRAKSRVVSDWERPKKSK